MPSTRHRMTLPPRRISWRPVTAHGIGRTLRRASSLPRSEPMSTARLKVWETSHSVFRYRCGRKRPASLARQLSSSSSGMRSLPRDLLIRVSHLGGQEQQRAPGNETQCVSDIDSTPSAGTMYDPSVARQRIVPMGGGGFAVEPRNPRLERWLLSLTRRRRNPRVLFVPTASGDARQSVERFYRAFGRFQCRPEHLALFNRTETDLRKPIVSADLIYVGGGNTANMLVIWRTHGVDLALREAWQSGVVLCGVSAGAICWFRSGVTDSFGVDLQPMRNSLGFLPGISARITIATRADDLPSIGSLRSANYRADTPRTMVRRFCSKTEK